MSSVPNDTRAIKDILSSMDVQDYDPQVVLQLWEFVHNYASEVLDRASSYAKHANRSENINEQDIKLAIKNHVEMNFQKIPPNPFLFKLAQERNSLPLRIPRGKYGIILPEDDNTTIKPNYSIITKPPKKKKKSKKKKINKTQTENQQQQQQQQQQNTLNNQNEMEIEKEN
ncbi:taf9 RNA polymerase ii [Anaeramoeba flamelloides]|uniref:Taf9 RNA polymerase ii n=1 Tax=Anaeramoeba flamelloides TaxID=1746091 RepID=A0ABQ8YFR0_9EUKA|nr:taf9 RNA polymerase ii [Anaeramoeba flamelloides]KAJ6243443.1 taf9 RNA polymerase ii [Anaeramoeba flamelloides]